MGMKIIGSITNIQKVTDFSKEAVTRIQASDIDINKYLYIKGRVMTCNEMNANGDWFSSVEVQKTYETFIGGIVDYNHDQEKVMGRVIDAMFKESPEDGLDYVEVIAKIDKSAYPEYTKQIEEGKLCQMSLEAFANKMRCSVCGHEFDYTTIKPCKHIEGGLNRKIMADDGTEKTVYREDMELTFTGFGIVPNPADKRADIYTVMANENENEVEDKDNVNENEVAVENNDKINLSEALKKLNAMEFIEIIKAVETKVDKAKKICNEILSSVNGIMTEPEFYTMISEKYNRLNGIEIEEIKKNLKESNKLIDNIYGAYILNQSGEKYWMVTVNGKPEIKKKISEIWSSEWNKGVEIEGKALEEYAVSDEFKKELLMALQTKGVEELKASWEIKSETNDIKEKIKKEAFIFDTGYYLKNKNAETQALALSDRAYEIVTNNVGNEYNKLIEWRDNHYEHGTDRYDIMTNIATLFKPTMDKLEEIKAFAKLLNINVSGEQIVEAMFSNNIEAASKTVYVKDRFCQCLKENENNAEIKLKANQSKQDALEAFCYNKVVRSSVMASGNDKVKSKEHILYQIIGGYDGCIKNGYDNGMCAWLEKTVKGNVDNMSMSKRVMAIEYENKNIKEK